MHKFSKCNSTHSEDWLVLYDIGKQQTEQILVCKKCFENITNDCFRLFVISKTPQGPDGGIDLLASKGNITIGIQAKNWKNNVSNTHILKTAGARQMYNYSYAMVITSSNFTNSAKETIQKTPRIRGTEITGLKRQIQYYFKKESKKSREISTIKKITNKIIGKKNPTGYILKPKVPEGKLTPIRTKTSMNSKRSSNKRKSHRTSKPIKRKFVKKYSSRKTSNRG